MIVVASILRTVGLDDLPPQCLVKTMLLEAHYMILI